nr:PD40 domain-containing protein [Bacteroidota bacterium]
MKFISTLLFVLVSTGIFSQQPIQITNNPALDMRPVWTPDGSQLCFVSNRSSDKSSGWYGFSIWNIPAAGGMAEKIEINRQSIHHLDLSPDSDFIVFYDGQNIAFASNRSGNFDIWIKDMESGEL